MSGNISHGYFKNEEEDIDSQERKILDPLVLVDMTLEGSLETSLGDTRLSSPLRVRPHVWLYLKRFLFQR